MGELVLATAPLGLPSARLSSRVAVVEGVAVSVFAQAVASSTRAARAAARGSRNLISRKAGRKDEAIYLLVHATVLSSPATQRLLVVAPVPHRSRGLTTANQQAAGAALEKRWG